MAHDDEPADPSWIKPGIERKTPYTEAELDRLVTDFVRGLDASEWQAIKKQYGGDQSARERIRAGFIKLDANNLANMDPTGPIHEKAAPQFAVLTGGFVPGTAARVLA